MVEEFDLLEEVEVQFCDEECTESVWHGVNYSESLFCREKPKSELTVVIREEGMMYFLTADIKEFAGLCRKHGWYIVSHQRFSEAMEIGMCLMEAGKHAGWYSLGRSKEWNAMMRDVLNFTFEREKKMDFYPYETMFKGEVLIDGCRCHYLHDYYPTKIEKTNAHQKRVSNLIFRFKEGGHCGAGRTDTGTVSETCGIQRNEGRYGTDTYTRINKGKTAETLSGGMLLSVGMAGHYGRFQGHLDRGRPRATERKGKG